MTPAAVTLRNVWLPRSAAKLDEAHFGAVPAPPPRLQQMSASPEIEAQHFGCVGVTIDAERVVEDVEGTEQLRVRAQPHVALSVGSTEHRRASRLVRLHANSPPIAVIAPMISRARQEIR